MTSPLNDLGISLAVISAEYERAKSANDFETVFQLGVATKDLVDRAGKRMAAQRSAEARASDAAYRAARYREMTLALWERSPWLRCNISRTTDLVIQQIERLPPEESKKLLRGKSTIMACIKSFQQAS